MVFATYQFLLHLWRIGTKLVRPLSRINTGFFSLKIFLYQLYQFFQPIYSTFFSPPVFGDSYFWKNTRVFWGGIDIPCEKVIRILILLWNKSGNKKVCCIRIQKNWYIGTFGTGRMYVRNCHVAILITTGVCFRKEAAFRAFQACGLWSAAAWPAVLGNACPEYGCFRSACSGSLSSLRPDSDSQARFPDVLLCRGTYVRFWWFWITRGSLVFDSNPRFILVLVLRCFKDPLFFIWGLCAFQFVVAYPRFYLILA